MVFSSLVGGALCVTPVEKRTRMEPCCPVREESRKSGKVIQDGQGNQGRLPWLDDLQVRSIHWAISVEVVADGSDLHGRSYSRLPCLP